MFSYSVLPKVICIYIFIFINSRTVYSMEDEDNIDMEADIPVVEGFGGTITIPEEDEVLILNRVNFDHIVGTKDFILVEFYAPWCGHCKSLDPEYAAAAKDLKKDGIRIAKVDATVEEDLAKAFDITGFPTLKLFKKGDFVEDFDGSRTATAIIEFMRKHADPNYKPPPSVVKVLTAANFSEFVHSEKLSLVEFYAPWCGHCKKLAPEYEGAALDLQDKKIPLAMVDATVEKTLALEYNVRGYPKFLVFRHGRFSEFKGPRERLGLAQYMRDQMLLPSILVQTPLDAKNKIPRAEPCVFAVFQEQNELYEEYIAAVNGMRGDSIFIHTFDADLAQKYGFSINSINIIFPEILTSKYEEKKPCYKKSTGTQSEISSWISATLVPLVGERSRTNLATRYSKRPLLVVYYDVDFSHQHVIATQLVRSKILSAASQHRDLTFAISSEEEFADDLKTLGLDDSGEDVNVGIFGDDNLKFRMEPEEDFDSDVLEEFVLKFKKGQLKPYLKSQPIPKRQEGPVRIVVAESFEEDVLRTEKDVLLEFYAPWCGHCKKLEPVYKKLAKFFAKERPNLLVAKMDASANDVHPLFTVHGFPTIYLLKASDKENPVPMGGGETTLAGFKKFVKEQLSPIPSKEEL